MKTTTRIGWGLAIVLSLPACYPSSVSGTVRNIQGEALPGVVVQVSGEDAQAVTDARGNYRIASAPPDGALDFFKTGYAPAKLLLDSNTRRQETHGDVQMWQLPKSAGAYLLENHRYKQISWVIPQQFFMSDGTVAYGTRSDPSPATHRSEPTILCYRTPRYDARLSRLIRAKPMQPSSTETPFEIWTAGGTIDADLVPVDTPRGMLRRLRIDRPLESGVYAVHWGALEGYTTLENRVFMFEVADLADDEGALVSKTELSPPAALDVTPKDE